MFISIFLNLIVYQSLKAETPNFDQSEVRKNCRQEIISNEVIRFPHDKSIILNNDRAEDLVENPSKMIYSVVEMEKNNLLNKHVSHTPWSDSYWPIYQGSLGHRYNDPNVRFGDWKEEYDYVLAHPASELIKNKELEYLSPSEKYDLVMGLGKDNLTKANWAEGEVYFKENGSVETWMGICHGWSAASTMMPTPTKMIEVNTSAGKVHFYPSDIKALASQMWAKGKFTTRFIGGRCNTKGPVTDEMGRPKEADCLDTNPGTWHLAIVNQIGQFDRSFVMDATYDYQVWNQPVYGYSYTYFNPQTSIDTHSLNEATVLSVNWNDDPRKKVRSPKTKSIVGIKMQVTYVTESTPSKDENEEPRLTTIEWQYDLELDQKNNIIGGEWYSENHPDFLWTPDKNAFPETLGDNLYQKLNLDLPSKSDSKSAAANAKYELPFGPMVREVFHKSSGN